MNDIKTADELVQLYNAQADLLSQAVQALQKERDDVQRENAYLVKALTAARDECAYAEQSRDAIAADRDTRAAKIEDMADASREATELLQTLTKERDGIKASLLTMRTDRDFVMEQLATARKMRDDVLAAHSETRSKLSHQCDENEALRKTLLATTEERNDLRTTAKAIFQGTGDVVRFMCPKCGHSRPNLGRRLKRYFGTRTWICGECLAASTEKTE